ncbi:MAG: hypothetical protein NT106_14910 [Candidatus Sumerlaeota bacterium]|nr:hypothetical protein [Candidatus Sumerlaeota bacterium]
MNKKIRLLLIAALGAILLPATGVAQTISAGNADNWLLEIPQNIDGHSIAGWAGNYNRIQAAEMMVNGKLNRFLFYILFNTTHSRCEVYFTRIEPNTSGGWTTYQPYLLTHAYVPAENNQYGHDEADPSIRYINVINTEDGTLFIGVCFIRDGGIPSFMANAYYVYRYNDPNPNVSGDEYISCVLQIYDPAHPDQPNPQIISTDDRIIRNPKIYSNGTTPKGFTVYLRKGGTGIWQLHSDGTQTTTVIYNAERPDFQSTAIFTPTNAFTSSYFWWCPNFMTPVYDTISQETRLIFTEQIANGNIRISCIDQGGNLSTLIPDSVFGTFVTQILASESIEGPQFLFTRTNSDNYFSAYKFHTTQNPQYTLDAVRIDTDKYDAHNIMDVSALSFLPNGRPFFLTSDISMGNSCVFMPEKFESYLPYGYQKQWVSYNLASKYMDAFTFGAGFPTTGDLNLLYYIWLPPGSSSVAIYRHCPIFNPVTLGIEYMNFFNRENKDYILARRINGAIEITDKVDSISREISLEGGLPGMLKYDYTSFSHNSFPVESEHLYNMTVNLSETTLPSASYLRLRINDPSYLTLYQFVIPGNQADGEKRQYFVGPPNISNLDAFVEAFSCGGSSQQCIQVNNISVNSEGLLTIDNENPLDIIWEFNNRSDVWFCQSNIDSCSLPSANQNIWILPYPTITRTDCAQQPPYPVFSASGYGYYPYPSDACGASTKAGSIESGYVNEYQLKAFKMSLCHWGYCYAQSPHLTLDGGCYRISLRCWTKSYNMYNPNSKSKTPEIGVRLTQNPSDIQDLSPTGSMNSFLSGHHYATTSEYGYKTFYVTAPGYASDYHLCIDFIDTEQSNNRNDLQWTLEVDTIRLTRIKTQPTSSIPNDESSGAIEVICGDTITGCLTCGATPSGVNTCNPTIRDVWYRIVAPVRGTGINVYYKPKGGSSGFAALFLGSGYNNLQQIRCDNEMMVDQYYVCYETEHDNETIWINIGSDSDDDYQELIISCFDKLN